MDIKQKFVHMVENSPVIGAIKDENGLCSVIKSDCAVVFVLYGTACSIGKIVDKLKEHNKLAIVHIDLIDGLSTHQAAVDFVKNHTKADGIISTKQQIVKYAKSVDFFVIQRYFMLDSIALSNVSKQLAQETADAIEILPGVMPKIIKRLCQSANKPLIAGGLILDKDDVVQALSAGAVAVSTTNEKIWSI